ncbi:MAG: hypothetical protein RLZZ584_2365 [Pseudomonadota bacterium]
MSAVTAAPAALRDGNSNIVLLEHVNLAQPDPALATLFHVVGLGLTRDPYLMVGVDNMWINAGATQIHLPTRPAQRLPGAVHLAVPDLAWVGQSLATVAPRLAGTAFGVARVDDGQGGALVATCPWGNRYVCHASAPGDAVRLGITAVEVEVAAGMAAGIARFYAEVMGAPARCTAAADGLAATVVDIRRHQQLRFVETHAVLPAWDGHHVQLYLADAAAVRSRCLALGIVSRDAGASDWRCIDIVDPRDGRLLHRLEHELRGLDHPLFDRPLVNRNPAQRQAGYRPGADSWAAAWDAHR